MRALTLTLIDDHGAPWLTPGVLDRLLSELDGVADADVVVVQGANGCFCQGLHLQPPVREDTILPGLQRLATLLSTLQRCGRPVVALVDGPALGGGLGLAAAADLVLATRRARFGLPETVMGLIPAVVFPAIAARVGVPRSRLLALGTPALAVEEAHRWGLVDELVDDLNAARDRHLARFRRMDRGAAAAVKRLSADYFGVSSSYVEDAANDFVRLFRSPAASERLQRFAAGLTPWPDEGE